MAEEEKKEKKKAGSERMYGKSPHIERKEKKSGDKMESEGGAPKEAAAKAEETAGEPKAEANMDDASVPGGEGAPEAKGDVMAGTDGIETHHTSSAERMEGHSRRMGEHSEMMHRHEREHLLRATGNHKEDHASMSKRHHGEMRAMHTRHEREHKEVGERHAGIEMPQESVGTEGTEQ